MSGRITESTQAFRNAGGDAETFMMAWRRKISPRRELTGGTGFF